MTRSTGIPPNHLRRGSAAFASTAWLGLLSASGALAVTVVLFDRTTLGGITKLWLASLGLCFTVAFVWWTHPAVIRRRIQVRVYEPAALLVATTPLVLLSLSLVAADYLSDSAHNYLFVHFYYRELLSERNWPVMLLAAATLGSGQLGRRYWKSGGDFGEAMRCLHL